MNVLQRLWQWLLTWASPPLLEPHGTKTLEAPLGGHPYRTMKEVLRIEPAEAHEYPGTLERRGCHATPCIKVTAYCRRPSPLPPLLPSPPVNISE